MERHYQTIKLRHANDNLVGFSLTDLDHSIEVNAKKTTSPLGQTAQLIEALTTKLRPVYSYAFIIWLDFLFTDHSIQ